MNNENENMILEIFPRDKNVRKNAMTEKTEKMILKHRSPLVSFSGKKRKWRFSLRRLILPLFSFFIAYLLISVYVEENLKGEITELAKAQAEKHLLETVNLAVSELAEQGEFRYGNMVSTIRDEKGEVIYLEVNTAALNAAKSYLVAKIDESLENNKKIVLSVPMGSLSGWNLFSGIGLPVRVRVYPIGMTRGDIYTVLEDCGINQTRHLIQVNIVAKLLVVLPGENTEVQTEVTLPLGERVLVGEVPEIYLDTLGVN